MATVQMQLAGKEEGLWESIWDLSWPMLIIMIFNFFVGLADIYVAGLIGPAVQAAVGFITQIYFFVIILANAISIGTLALVARAIGEGNRAKAMSIARQSLLFSLLVGCCLTLPGVLFPGEIIALAGFPEEIREIAVRFLQIFSLALGPNYILIISNAVFRAVGDVKKPLYTMSFVSLINILGDFVLVVGIASYPGMGYIGIAIATASSVFAGMVINLLLFTLGWWQGIYHRPYSLSFGEVRRIIRVGWPAAMLQIAWSAGYILLYNILGRLGDRSIIAIASITNGLRIEAIVFLPAFALNMAASVLIGQSLGSGNPGRAEALGWKIAKAGVWITGVMSLVIFATADRLASGLTTNPAVLAETARYLRFNMTVEPFMALSMVLGGGLQGAGDTRGTMWIIIASMWFIRLPLAYYLGIGLDYGPAGVWTAMISSMVFQGVFMTLRFRGGRWKEIQLD